MPRKSTAAPGTPAELRAKLAEVVKSRKAAEKKGAWTAVGTMHRLEADILKALQPPPEPVAKNPYEGIPDDAVLVAVVDLLRGMPDALVERVDDVVQARLGRATLRVVSGTGGP